MKSKAVHMDKARRGYAAISTENFASLVGDAGKPNDTVEKFRMGPLSADSPSSEESASNSSVEMNTWTGTPAGFEDHLSEYYRCMEQLTGRLLKILAAASGLNEDFFTEKMNSHSSILTLNYYLELPSGAGDLRVAEHTDVSMVTIVAQSGPGLQILRRSSESGETAWVDIPYVPGALVVNIGDCLSDWSDGLLSSTRHRVVIPATSSSAGTDGSGSGSDSGGRACRSSLAYFVTPRYDARLSPWSSAATGSQAEATADEEDAGPTFSEWRKKRVARAIKMLKTNPMTWKHK